MPTHPHIFPLGVEIRLLIERDAIGGVLAAEDVAAVTAVVATFPDAEGFLADGEIADRGAGVRFPVVARRVPGDGGQVGGLVEGKGELGGWDVGEVGAGGGRMLGEGIGGGSPTGWSARSEFLVQAVCTAVDASRRG